MKLIRHIPAFLRNKYYLTFSVFAVWMLFFDRNDLFTQLGRNSDLNEIEQSKVYFTKKITENKKFSREIQSNAAAIEKFAREKYLMKRENEDLFLIEKPDKHWFLFLYNKIIFPAFNSAYKLTPYNLKQ